MRVALVLPWIALLGTSIAAKEGQLSSIRKLSHSSDHDEKFHRFLTRITRPKFCRNIPCENPCLGDGNICGEDHSCKFKRRLSDGQCCPDSKCIPKKQMDCTEVECVEPCTHGNNPCNSDEVCTTAKRIRKKECCLRSKCKKKRKPLRPKNCPEQCRDPCSNEWNPCGDDQYCRVSHRIRKNECCPEPKCFFKEQIKCDQECPEDPCMEGHNPCDFDQICTPAKKVRKNECCLRAKCSPLEEGTTDEEGKPSTEDPNPCDGIWCDDPCNGVKCQIGEVCENLPLLDGQCCPKAHCAKQELDCSLVKCAVMNACTQDACPEGYTCESVLAEGSCCHSEPKCSPPPPPVDCSLVRCSDPCFGHKCGEHEVCERFPKEDGQCCHDAKCVEDCSKVLCFTNDLCRADSCRENEICESYAKPGHCCVSEVRCSPNPDYEYKPYTPPECDSNPCATKWCGTDQICKEITFDGENCPTAVCALPEEEGIMFTCENTKCKNPCGACGESNDPYCGVDCFVETLQPGECCPVAECAMWCYGG